MTGSSGAIYFGMDGSAVVQERAVGQRGSWSYQPLAAGGPCVLRMRWTVGFIAGRPEKPIDPPSEWVLQPVSVTPTAFHLKSVDTCRLAAVRVSGVQYGHCVLVLAAHFRIP